jgi:hypothetical protein
LGSWASCVIAQVKNQTYFKQQITHIHRFSEVHSSFSNLIIKTRSAQWCVSMEFIPHFQFQLK